MHDGETTTATPLATCHLPLATCHLPPATPGGGGNKYCISGIKIKCYASDFAALTERSLDHQHNIQPPAPYSNLPLCFALCRSRLY
jgi:hypothetical protein